MDAVLGSVSAAELELLQGPAVPGLADAMGSSTFQQSLVSGDAAAVASAISKLTPPLVLSHAAAEDLPKRQSFWMGWEKMVSVHWEQALRHTPWTLDQIAVDTMAFCLQDIATAASATLRAVRNEPLGVGHGMMSSMCRVRLDWEAPPAAIAALPASVVVKLTPLGQGQRVLSAKSSLLRMEALFYRTVTADAAARLGLAIPAVWYTDFREPSDRLTIVMEDLGLRGYGSVDQLRGMRLDEAEAMVQFAARLHSHYHGRVAELGFGTIRTQAMEDPIRRQNTAEGLRRGWAPFEATMAAPPYRLGPSSPVIQAARLYVHQCELFYQYFSGSASWCTVVHGDLRADNVMTTRAGAGGDGKLLGCVAIDMQCLKAAPGEFDLAYMLSQSLSTADRRVHEPALIRRYLALRGPRYPRAVSLYHYQLFLVYGLIRFGITTRSTSIGASDRGRVLERTVLLRTARAVADWNCLAVYRDALARAAAGSGPPTEAEARALVPPAMLREVVDAEEPPSARL